MLGLAIRGAGIALRGAGKALKRQKDFQKRITSLAGSDL